MSYSSTHTSKEITSPLVESIIQQTHSASDVTERQLQHKKNLLQMKHGKNIQTADDIEKKLLPPKCKCMQMVREKDASLWLTVLPLTSLDFTLHKAAFKDALAPRYDWPIANTPSHCCCGSQFSVDHAMSCPTGGFPSIRHNEVRDITARMLCEVSNGVTIEPHLQPVPPGSNLPPSANKQDNARLDFAAYGFWGGRFERTFVDVRVFNPCARSNQQSSLEATYRKHEQEKRRAYDRRVIEVERATFTPLVTSATGSMAKTSTIFYKRLAAMLEEKSNTPYSKVINLIRCRLRFCLLHAAIMCIRGSRSTATKLRSEPYDVQCAAAGL